MGVDNGLPHSPPPFVKALEQAVELRWIVSAPLPWNLARAGLELRQFQVFDPPEKLVKRVERAHALIHDPARIKASELVVRKTPFPVIKTETVIDEPGRIGRIFVVRGTIEDHLAPVAVAGPLVEDVGPEEKFGKLPDAAQEPVREKIHDERLTGISGKEGAEL